MEGCCHSLGASNNPLRFLSSFQARSLSLQGWGLTDLLLARSINSAITFSRVAWSILDCARRTSTFLSCAFREQEDDQATLLILLRARVPGAQDQQGCPSIPLSCAFREHRRSSGSIPFPYSHRPSPPDDLSPSIATSCAHEAVCLHLLDHPGRPRITHP
jgi:hypothetical protein